MDYWLINEAWIKRYTPIGEFVDVEAILPWIKVAEEIDIRSALGEQLFNRLKQGVEFNNLTSDETILLDLVRPALAYAIVAHSIPFIATQIRGAGVVKPLNTNIQPASDIEVKSLETKSRNMSDYYIQRVLDHLCKNSSKYPLWHQVGNPSADPTPRWGVGTYFGCSCSGKCNCWLS
jgi:hypothetical protein